jgi:hypothetical protein
MHVKQSCSNRNADHADACKSCMQGNLPGFGRSLRDDLLRSLFTSYSHFAATLKTSQKCPGGFMTSLSLAVPGELNWSKIPHQSGFELKQNGEILARLQKPKFWSCSMRVEVDVLPRRFLAQHYRGYRRGLEGHTCPLDAKLERGWNADVQRRADFSGVAPVVLERCLGGEVRQRSVSDAHPFSQEKS